VEKHKANKFTDTPLTIAADRNLLFMAIGVEQFAYAYEESPDNNPYVDEKHDFVRQWKVESPAQFARDVAKALRLELLAEREDGSTPLSDLLDAACIRAIEDGSDAVVQYKPKPVHVCKPSCHNPCLLDD